MGLLGSLLGKPPKLPADCRAFAWHDDRGWQVVAVDKVTSRYVKRLSPPFTLQTTAYDWLDKYEQYISGKTKTFEFRYPAGAA